MRGVRHPAVHDAPQRQPAQTPWLVLGCWLLALLPSLYLALSGSNNLTGGGFDVAGSQSLHVQYELEDHFPRAGRLTAGAGRRTSRRRHLRRYGGGRRQLEQAAQKVPSLSLVPNPTQPAPAPTGPMWCRCGWISTTPAPSTSRVSSRKAIGVSGDQPGRTDNGRVRLYVIGQGALGAAAQSSTRDDIADAERWNLPIVLMVLVAVFGSLAAAAIPLALGICTVAVTMGVVYLLSTMTHDVGVRHLDGVDVRYRAGDRLLAVHPDALPRGTAGRTRPGSGRRRRDGDLRPGGGAVRPDRDRLAHRASI